MNRTQKAAVFGLVIWMACLAFGIFIIIEMMILKTMYYRIHQVCALFIVIAAAICLPFMFKKQSKKEVESDERDRLIQLKAALAGSISGWLALAAELLICRFFLGSEGMLAVWVITLILMLAFVLAMMAYWIAILWQYRLGTCDGKE